MNALKKIRYNCRHATFLIEKKQLNSIDMRGELELRFHLAGCEACRTYQTQSKMIGQMVKVLFRTSQDLVKIDEDFKEGMRREIAEKLKAQ